MKSSAPHETPQEVISSLDRPSSPTSWPEAEEWRPETHAREGGGEEREAPAQPDPPLHAGSPPPLTPAQRDALETVVRVYGLDPNLGEVVIAQGTPYIPLRGLLKLAHRSPRPPAGAELRPASAEERRASLVPDGAHYWRAALFQQGSTRPYVEWGLATPDEGLDRKLSPRELADLAKSRAVARALRLGWPPEPVTEREGRAE
ncbi:MAG: hypothetical protein ACE5JJ_06380 [Nitrospinota bacterium]